MITEISREMDSYQKTHARIDEVNMKVRKAVSDFPEQRDFILETAGVQVREIIKDYYHLESANDLRDIVKIRFGKGEYDTFDVHLRTGEIYYACAPNPAMQSHANKLWFQYGDKILAGLLKPF